MGNTVKAEMKVDIAHDIGARMDDLLEVAKRDLERAIGAQSALLEASKLIQALHGVADKELDEGKFDLETGQRVKHYVTRAVTALEAFAQKTTNLQQVASGKIQGLQTAVAAVKSFHDAALKDKRTLEATLAQQQVSSNTSSVAVGGAIRPGLSVKQLRLAEEAAQASASLMGVVLPITQKPLESSPSIDQKSSHVEVSSTAVRGRRKPGRPKKGS